MSSGRKKDDEEKKKKKQATVTYNRPVVGQDPAERPEGTATVTGVNSRAEAIEAYRADREKTQEKARQEYKNAIRQYQLKTGKTVDSPNAVTAEDRMWYRASNPTDTALTDTTRKIVEARRNTKQKKQELEDYDNQEFDWTDANARKAHEEGRKEKEAAVSQAEQEQNQATAESDRAIIGGLSDEGREKLTEYAKQKDRATGPRRESGSEIEQWFAENQHMNADELGNLAETVIRDKNAAHMEQEQQWARDVADAHPVAAWAATFPVNLVSGVASTAGNLGQAIDQKLNGEGHYTGLDPNNEANLLQSMSGAARGEIKGNIVGDGSNPLRTITGGGYDLLTGILDTKARLALGTLTGGGSLLGMGIAGANQFGNAVQDAASRGASTEQALGYAAATSVVDALTEKIPLDNLLSISTAKGGTGRIMQMLSGILGEGAQETASQLASVFTDAGIMRDKSERNLGVAQMMVQNPGMSLEEAQAIVDKGILWDMIYNVAIAGAGGGFNALLATFERDWANKKGRNTAAQNPQEQPAQAAAEAPDSEKAAPLDGEQMAIALAGQEQPARAGDLLAESEAEFDKAFDRVMNQESQKPTPESQTEAPQTEMERRARMALGMESETPVDNGTPKVYDNNSKLGGMNNAGADQLQGTDGEGLPRGNEAGRIPGSTDRTLQVSGQASGTMESGTEVVPGSVQGKPGGSNTPDDLRVPGELRVSDALTEAQQRKGTPTYPVKDTTTEPGKYEQALTAGRNSDPQNGWCVTPKSAKELKDGNVRTFTDENGTVGVGVAPDGDIVGVFKNKDGGPKKALDTMMPIAIEQGGDRLDCYGEGLVNLYAKYGFEPVARVEFNPEYANEGWTPDKGTPYIYVMKHNGDSADAVVDKMGTYPKYTDAQLDALPTYGKDDYDKAMAYRDSLMQQSQPAAQTKDATPVSKVDFNYQRVNPANSYASINDGNGKYTLYADGTIDDGGILGKASQMQGWKDSGLFALYDVTVNGKPVAESGDLPNGLFFAENVTKKPSIRELGANGAAGIAEKGKIELVDMDTHARNRDIGNQANESPVQPTQAQPAEPKAQTQTQVQNTQPVQQPKVQNEQPVQQQAAPQEMPQEAQGGAQRAETNGQAQTPGGYVPGAQASAEGGNVQRSRPGDVRPMEVPKTDQEGKRVTEFAGNAYGAQATPDSMAEEIKTLANDGSLSFDTRTNQQSLEQAADYIGKRGADTVRGEITARAASGKMDDGDIEKAMLLYTRYANDNSPKSQEAASEMMVALSSMANKTGRNLQMFGMMRKMTPEGQLMTVEKTVEQNVKRLQQRGMVKKGYVSDGVDAELEADYLKAAKKAKKAADPEARKAAAKELRAAEDAIYKAEAAKMPATFAAKWNAWRYMSMMGNLRSNVRNVEGNAGFMPYKAAKDKLGALAEKVLLPKEQRTKSLTQDADLLAWAKEDTKTDLVQDALQYTGLLGDDASTQKLEEGKRVFKNNALEGYRKLAEELPAKGDTLFKNNYYARSLAGFLKARGISVDDITSGNVDQKILTEARNYSINEAMKATFNDANALSDAISGLRYTGDNPVGKVLNAMGEGVLPFRRTPANIVVRFKDYSPIGLLQGVWDAAKNVSSGKITAAGAIDEICAGVTGTGAMMLGYAMAKGMGGVKLVGSDVDEDEKRQGHQQYALEFSIGGQEYSYKIDWAAPANLPLFVGANVAKMLEDGGNDADVSTFSKFLTAGKGMFEPMLELSMLSSLNELVSSGKYSGESGLYPIATGMITSYLTQAVPTILRQADTASQKYAQTTYANSADPNIRELQRTAANLPFVGRAFKTDKVDAWGEKVDNGSLAVRAFNAFVNPGTMKKIQESPLEQEITRLNGTQESNVSPDSVPRVVSYTDEDGEYIEDLRLTDDQYEKWATTQGQTARRIQDDLVKNSNYQNLSDKQKAEALNLAKEYAKEQGKRAALAGYPETGESWMVGIDGKEAAAIVDKVNAGTLQNAIAGLSEAMKSDWNTGNREKTLEEGYAAYEKMDAQTKARVAESVTGDTAKYLEAREAGVSTTAYLKVLDAVKHADGTGNSATYRAITSASISESAMDKLMKAYMPDYDPDKPKSDKTELKYDYARKELGMTPAEYAKAYEIYQSFSGYGKGKAKKQRAALAEIYGADMAKKLWKLYGGKLDVVDWWEDQQ